jgi:hypothetical protein
VFYIDTRRSICLLSVSLDTRRTSHITDPSCASHPASVHTSPIPYLPPEPYRCSPDLISLIPSFTLDRDLPTALAPYLTAPPLHSLSLDLECRPTATTAVRHPALTRPGGGAISSVGWIRRLCGLERQPDPNQWRCGMG